MPKSIFLQHGRIILHPYSFFFFGEILELIDGLWIKYELPVLCPVTLPHTSTIGLCEVQQLTENKVKKMSLFSFPCCLYIYLPIYLETSDNS